MFALTKKFDLMDDTKPSSSSRRRKCKSTAPPVQQPTPSPPEQLLGTVKRMVSGDGRGSSSRDGDGNRDRGDRGGGRKCVDSSPCGGSGGCRVVASRITALPLWKALSKRYQTIKESNTLLKVGFEKAESSTQKLLVLSEPLVKKLDHTLNLDERASILLHTIDKIEEKAQSIKIRVSEIYSQSLSYCSTKKEAAFATGKLILDHPINHLLDASIELMHKTEHWVAQVLPPEISSEMEKQGFFEINNLHFGSLTTSTTATPSPTSTTTTATTTIATNSNVLTAIPIAIESKNLARRMLFLGRSVLYLGLGYFHSGVLLAKTKDHLRHLYYSATERILGGLDDEVMKEVFKEEVCYAMTAEGTFRIVNHYLLLDTIGRGKTGKVKHAQHIRTRKEYAIKIFNKKELKRRRGLKKCGPSYQDVCREVELMKILKHPNIVQLFQVIDDQNSDKLYLVMEYMPGGSIMDAQLRYTVSLQEDLIKDYFVGLIKAVKYIHSINIIHRDIKPENVLISPSKRCAKICDFSSAEHLVDGKYLTGGSAGTPAFMAPELCQEYVVPPLGCPIDIWSLGVTLYCLGFGRYPFEGRTLHEMYINIINKTVKFSDSSYNNIISDNLKDLVNKMLTKNPTQRITLTQIQEHSWFSNTMW